MSHTQTDAAVVEKAFKVLTEAGNPDVTSTEGKCILVLYGVELSYNESIAVQRMQLRRDRESFIREMQDITEERREALLGRVGHRGAINPTPTSLTHLAVAARRVTSQFGTERPAWKADPEATCNLLLKDALRVASSQESWSDDVTYVIPYEGEVSDLAATKARLSAFFRRADSHTGMAGSGSNFTLVDIDTKAKLVELHQRISIAD